MDALLQLHRTGPCQRAEPYRPILYGSPRGGGACVRMKERMAMIALAVICLAAGILLGNAWVGMRSSSVYTSIRNEDNYLLEFHPLNMEHAETYQMTEGSSHSGGYCARRRVAGRKHWSGGKGRIYTANNAESASGHSVGAGDGCLCADCVRTTSGGKREVHPSCRNGDIIKKSQLGPAASLRATYTVIRKKQLNVLINDRVSCGLQNLQSALIAIALDENVICIIRRYSKDRNRVLG